MSPAVPSYQARLSSEVRRYETCTDVHALPEIFHYWSNRHIRPKLLPHGFGSPQEMFASRLAAVCESNPQQPSRFVSLGCGNGDLEISLALGLRERGASFFFDCLDVNPVMLDRARASAASCGLADSLSFLVADLNSWTPAAPYSAALANQSLHHVVNLEHLIAAVRHSLRPEGVFLISDMIGRNGHRRWPEALEILHDIWRGLPPSCRFNNATQLYESLYIDHDCSGEGFEGVRSQDILPILADNFRFRVFIPFGNLIDPFVDRVFGPNFDPTLQWDRDFIDSVHARDESEIAAGRLTPTHLLAVAELKSGSATELIINPRHEEPSETPSKPVYAPDVFRHAPRGLDWELEIACRRLQDATDRVTRAEPLIGALEKVLEERTAWARGLDEQLSSRTAWALSLDKEVNEQAERILRLQEQLDRQSRRALELERELHGYIHNPIRVVKRLLSALLRRTGML